ncbi:hypothetical protein ElyMa_004987000 [Elysia marginata]|uniref:Uncharacterized protein n=1 Tax=Elysia marginata TaxID=1093978 RepID=A0AAV4J4F6_9GAST|nr:hypothetical protein ElyMa_004987000 [Elysia marginata]
MERYRETPDGSWERQREIAKVGGWELFVSNHDSRHSVQRLLACLSPQLARASWGEGALVQLDKDSDTDRQIDKANKALTKAILSAAHECIPRGSRRNYIPYWSEELQALHEEVTEARDNVEKEPSVDNNIRLKAKTARFRRESNTAVRNSWH